MKQQTPSAPAAPAAPITPTTPPAPAMQASQPPAAPKAKDTNKTVILLVIVIFLSGLLAVFGLVLTKKSRTSLPAPSPAAVTTPSPTAEPTSNLITYTNTAYGFELKYPPAYKEIGDTYGWPKAILLLYKGGQSYDLVVETWDSQAEYEAKYKVQAGILTVKQSGQKFITLLNANKDPEVDQIIATFKLLE